MRLQDGGSSYAKSPTNVNFFHIFLFFGGGPFPPVSIRIRWGNRLRIRSTAIRVADPTPLPYKITRSGSIVPTVCRNKYGSGTGQKEQLKTHRQFFVFCSHEKNNTFTEKNDISKPKAISHIFSKQISAFDRSLVERHERRLTLMKAGGLWGHSAI